MNAAYFGLAPEAADSKRSQKQVLITFIKRAFLPCLISVTVTSAVLTVILSLITLDLPRPSLLFAVLTVAFPITLLIGMPVYYCLWRVIQHSEIRMNFAKAAVIGFVVGFLLDFLKYVVLGGGPQASGYLFPSMLIGGLYRFSFSVLFFRAGGFKTNKDCEQKAGGYRSQTRGPTA